MYAFVPLWTATEKMQNVKSYFLKKERWKT
jgi:hypothetical protein